MASIAQPSGPATSRGADLSPVFADATLDVREDATSQYMEDIIVFVDTTLDVRPWDDAGLE